MSEIDERVREGVCALLSKHKGVYTNPEYISREHVATALTTLTHAVKTDTNSHIHFGPFAGGIEVIHGHEWMPSKVQWAAKLEIAGVDEPLWASYTEDWGVDIQADKLYWLTDKYQENADTEP